MSSPFVSASAENYTNCNCRKIQRGLNMIQTRFEIEQLERTTLAPYAMKSGDSEGRRVQEEEPEYRSAFQRDRDRIIHTTAFRRLEYKTQVFVITEGDHYRTRLTHSIEVAQIGRSLARALRANEDLTEAICLAHDLDTRHSVIPGNKYSINS